MCYNYSSMWTPITRFALNFNNTYLYGIIPKPRPHKNHSNSLETCDVNPNDVVQFKWLLIQEAILEAGACSGLSRNACQISPGGASHPSGYAGGAVMLNVGFVSKSPSWRHMQPHNHRTTINVYCIF